MTSQSRNLMKPGSLRTTARAVSYAPQHARSALALGLSASLMSPLAMAQDEELFELDTLQIEDRTLETNPYAEPGAPYKARTSGDARKVKPLADTPQTITVLTESQIEDSGKSDLKEILAAQPGITLGTGENGNAFGDRYVIRGHEARSDVFVDGLRDPGMTTRESFALEQVEVTKGPSSTFAGRGSTGGAVNGITKQASTGYAFNKLDVGAGTDDYRRITLDTNQPITDDVAMRVNLLHAYEEVPDRGPADRERNGAAVSGRYQATDKLDLVADYYFLSANDNPDLGSYVDRDSNPNDDIPVYVQNEDFLASDVQAFTFQAGYDFTDNVRLVNGTRYGTTENDYVVTGARGTNRAASDPDAPGAETISLSSHDGWQEVEYLANVTNLHWDTELAGQRHQWVFSTELSRNKVQNGGYNLTNTGDTNCVVSGRGGDSAGYCIVGPDGNTVSDIHNVIQRDISRGDQTTDYEIDTVSVSAMDTIDLTDRWILSLGVRADRFDYSNKVANRDGTTSNYEYSDTLWNGHTGLVYKLTDNGNVYATYSTSAEINGGESDVGGNCGYGGLCGSEDEVGNSKPEKAENIELGTKWDLFDDKLLLTAAVFQITKDDVMEGADYETTGTLNTGKNRVEGVEIGLSGNITDKLSTQFGAAVMDAEVLESQEPEDEGKTLANFADKSLYMLLRYQATPAFAFGGAATYSSEVFVGQPDSGASDFGVPSYTVYDLFASYQFTRDLSVRVNVNNVTDEDYYLTAYRSGAFAYIGDARNAHATVSYSF